MLRVVRLATWLAVLVVAFAMAPAERSHTVGDGGIDGVINQDASGLESVYVRIKCYATASAVSEPEIRAFSGSPGAAKASKGVFVTTSFFT
jgi:restriction endonuclease Mrr